MAPAAEKGGRKDVRTFEVGTLAVGGKEHARLRVTLSPLQRSAESPVFQNLPGVREAAKTDPTALAAQLSLDVRPGGGQAAGLA